MNRRGCQDRRRASAIESSVAEQRDRISVSLRDEARRGAAGNQERRTSRAGSDRMTPATGWRPWERSSRPRERAPPMDRSARPRSRKQDPTRCGRHRSASRTQRSISAWGDASGTPAASRHDRRCTLLPRPGPAPSNRSPLEPPPADRGGPRASRRRYARAEVECTPFKRRLSQQCPSGRNGSLGNSAGKGSGLRGAWSLELAA